jgi:predicted nucleotidyltransferase/biotin operon repressor
VSSLLFHPLDRFLGRASHVRVLRALSLHGGGLTPPELARRTGLSRRGAWNALESLEDAGIVEPVGGGHSVPYRLSDAHPLGVTLRRLFADEAERADTLISTIRVAAARLDPAPLAVWLFGSVARGEDRPGSDLDIAVVAEDGPAARARAESLRDALDGIGEQFGIRPSVISLSRSDLHALQAEDDPFWRRVVEDAVPLMGPPPDGMRP